MNDRALQDHQQQITPLKNFFLGRQPIFDRQQQLYAYELLFRRAPCGPAMVLDDLSATATVIAHAAELGMEKVIGESFGLINVDAAVLQSDFVKILPRDKIVLEILESVEPTPELIQQISLLARAGFRIALDDVVANSSHVQALLPLAQIVKLDISVIPRAELPALVREFAAAGKKLVAEKVEDQDQFELCYELGFDYFQGYYFARPVVLSGQKIEPGELAILEILALLNSEADNAEIERAIKLHITLSLNLLRLVNSPAISCAPRIASLSQALLLLGRRQLQRWLQILLYANAGKDAAGNQALLLLASTRGKLMELIASKLYPKDRVLIDTAFTVGIMSLMDSLFGLAMPEILQKMYVSESVATALLERTGLFGEMLRLAESIEHVDESGPEMASLLEHLHMSEEEFYLLELDAFDWADKLGSSVRKA